MADTEDSREKRRAYLAANRDEINAKRRALRAKNHGKALASNRAWKAANREKVDARDQAYRAANREILNAKNRAYRAVNAAKAKEAIRRWKEAHPAQYAFLHQRAQAKRRSVLFLLSFEQWWEIWQSSGKWEQRGIRSSHYCMARFGDRGAYECDNVRICTVRENHQEYFDNLDAEARRRISEGQKRRQAKARHNAIHL
jgi:hypothetical protein